MGLDEIFSKVTDYWAAPQDLVHLSAMPREIQVQKCMIYYLYVSIYLQSFSFRFPWNKLMSYMKKMFVSSPRNTTKMLGFV